MKLFLILIISTFSFALNLQKASLYDESKHNIKNWYMSEKLDGIRAYWNGEELLSKQGNKIFAPFWFTKDFPPFELDGELWTKRDDFENIQSTVLSKILNKEKEKQWENITYNIFEVPNEKGDFKKRLEKLKIYLEKNPSKYIQTIKQIKCKDKNHLDDFLKEILSKKGEGIMIKNPNLEYFSGRSENILKVKTFFDDEALVIGHNFNKEEKFKSLVLKLKNGTVFNLGGGFSLNDRKNPPKIGEIVTFKYYGFTKNNKPKFASFLRLRKTE